jgi:hypothetical protein
MRDYCVLGYKGIQTRAIIGYCGDWDYMATVGYKTGIRGGRREHNV